MNVMVSHEAIDFLPYKVFFYNFMVNIFSIIPVRCRILSKFYVMNEQKS